MMKSILVFVLLINCIFAGFVWAQGEITSPDSGTALSVTDSTSGNVSDSRFPESPAQQLATDDYPAVKSENSGNGGETVSLRDYIDRILDQQQCIIQNWIIWFSVIVTILIVLVLSQFINVGRQAERELKHLEYIRGKAETQIAGMIANAKDEIDKFADDLKVQQRITLEGREILDRLKGEMGTGKELSPSQKKEVERIVEQIIEKVPEEKRTAYDYFLMALESKEYEKKIEFYTKAIELNPGFADAYYNRAISYAAQLKYDEAIKDYSKAIELKPDHAAAYNNRGNSYAAQLKYDEAIKDYSKAIELNSDYASAYYNLACVYSMKNEIEEAFKVLDISAEKGFDKIELIRTDKQLDNLRGDPRFDQILKKVEENAKRKS